MQGGSLFIVTSLIRAKILKIIAISRNNFDIHQRQLINYGIIYGLLCSHVDLYVLLWENIQGILFGGSELVIK